MRRAARTAGLAAALALFGALASARAPRAAAAGEARPLGSGLERAVRDLDGEEYVADEPIWLCTDPSYAPATTMPGWLPHFYELRGSDGAGRPLLRRAADVALSYVDDPVSGTGTPRAGEFGQTFNFQDPSQRAPLLDFANGIPAGTWELHTTSGDDTTDVLARFRVVEPRGTERAVRDGLARAARLAHSDNSRLRTGDGSLQAGRLYEAILARYPRSAYVTVVYAGLWNVREHTRFKDDPDRWLEEVFARFHATCFGTVALDQWVRDMGEARARPTVARLVGLYPDTPLARAAQRYL